MRMETHMKGRIVALAAIGGTSLALAIGCAPASLSGGTVSPTPTGTVTATPTPTPPETGSVGPTGGSLDYLQFAIIGDTRPATKDDNGGYPTSIITQIYQDLEKENPYPAFGIATGDYIFASTTGSNASTQMDYYLGAQANYTKHVFHALGNHECNGYTNSNCGAGNTTGITGSYTTFLNKMLGGATLPYFAFRVNAKDGTWTAKFVVIAANAWDQTQADWLTAQMADPTTYTFVVRHEGIYSNTAPGVTPSQSIIAGYPYTLLLEGHTHSLAYYPNDRELITGIGGAPLTGSTDYGYVIASRLPSGKIKFVGYDYQNRSILRQFVVNPDGTQTTAP
jgi:hypothetical protein